MEKNEEKVEFIPIVTSCKRYYKGKNGECKNCHGTREYVSGYYMVTKNPVTGQKIAFSVDTLK